MSVSQSSLHSSNARSAVGHWRGAATKIRPQSDAVLRPVVQPGLRVARGYTIAHRSPWQNPFVERLIVLSEAHLIGILTAYFEYYHEARPHSSLDPLPTVPTTQDDVLGRHRTADLTDGRMDHVAVCFDEQSRWLTVERGCITVYSNLADQEQVIAPPSGSAHTPLLCLGEAIWCDENGARLPPDSGVVLGPAHLAPV